MKTLLRKLASYPLLIYRVFFNHWANAEEKKFLTWVESSEPKNKTALFFPQFPNKKAGLRNALLYLGYNITNDPNSTYDIAISWEDETYKKQSKLNKAVNKNCLDISKSYLDSVHQQVFKYGISVNPELTQGPILEKSEINGTHNARIIETPQIPKDGHVYQKLIDNRKGLLFEDIRPLVVGNDIPVCYMNYRLEGKRFSAKKIKASLVNPNHVLSQVEQQHIIELSHKMGADIAALDVLRDKKDGKIYVVDINVTAYGPVVGLSFENKKRAIKLYGKGLEKFIKDNF